SRETDAQRPRVCDSFSPPLFSLKMYLRRSSSAASSSIDPVSSSQQSNKGGYCSYSNTNDLCPKIWFKHPTLFQRGHCKRVKGLKAFMKPKNLPDCVCSSVDCAGMVLNCLFCRFYDMIGMLPDSCERVARHCCPNYKQVLTTAESTPSSDDDSHIDLDFGLFSSCHDASDCLELAMEVSELCYH
uniref:MyoD family inhibitor domain containing 2 n=1 Tax=Seriola lalandi dorsalis TaxID=1841481 RepID=A0A3B4XNP8_SERLL